MGVPLHFRTEGTAGPPLLILHGLLGSSSNWRTIARRLGADHRVLSLDLRNHGQSPHADSMSYPEMAEDVLELMQREGIETATLIGHSMGGKTAMSLALGAPERVRRLVVVDIAPNVSHHDHAPVLRAMAGLDLSRVARRADADALLAAAIPDTGMRMFVLQNLAGGPDGFSWRINLPAIETSMRDLLDFPVGTDVTPFPGPTRFVRGAASDYIGPGDEPVIRTLFPAADVVTVPDAGHWVHAEQPEAFLAALDGAPGAPGP